MSNRIALRDSGAGPTDLTGPADLTDLPELRGDCARMAPRWTARARPAAARVAPDRIHGVTVPAASARLVDTMPEYGDCVSGRGD